MKQAKEFHNQIKEGVNPCFPLCSLLADNISTSEENSLVLLSRCAAILSDSPVAKAMFMEASRLGWKISTGDLADNDFHLDVPEKLLIIDNNGISPGSIAASEYFLNVTLVSIIRALRDIWQEKRYGGFDEEYGPEAVLMLERIRAADCDVMVILIGWELQNSGNGGLWRHIIGSGDGDMAMAFLKYIEKDPLSLFSGSALMAAFDQWYCNAERVNSCDHETLEYLDDVISSFPGSNPFGNKNPGRAVVEVISCLPDKTAYLRGQGQKILSDPLYSGLDDAINQSHFIHILHDMEIIYVHGIPFRDVSLANKIFPGGNFTSNLETCYK